MSVIYITEVQDGRTLDSSPPAGAFAAVTILLNLQPRQTPPRGFFGFRVRSSETEALPSLMP